MIHKGKGYTLHLGNSLEVLDTLADNSVDSIVTDPPYEIGFMGKGWDNTGIAFSVEIWKKCLRVLKPGGHMVAFNHSRMFHRMMVAIEDAGFEIRDTIMWLYGSGFPKSFNIGKQTEAKILFNDASGRSQKLLSGTKVEASMWTHKMSYEQGAEKKDYSVLSTNKVIDVKYTTDEGKQWEGWGTALKPAYEPIVLARKPVQGSIVDNVLKWGVGGINIDECRVGTLDDLSLRYKSSFQEGNSQFVSQTATNSGIRINIKQPNKISLGRFPANVIHDGSEEVVSGFPESQGAGGSLPNVKITGYGDGIGQGSSNYFGGERTLFDSGSGSASRFFYTAKANQDDRNEGLDIAGFVPRRESDRNKDDGVGGDNPRNRTNNLRLNTHPTVKPTDLMKYLVRLITPKGGVVLDLFMGSGSTGKAVMLENAERQANYHFIGIDMTPEYVEIAKGRIEYAIANPFGEAKVVKVDGENILDVPLSLFE